MCTASWLIQPDGYELFFNRDESVRRGRASAPKAIELEGVRVLAPQDADAGGTWLGVNEFGLAVGLLNAKDAHPAPREPRSRGLLVQALLPARGGDGALARLEEQPLERYRGFVLVLFEPGRQARVLGWNGVELAPLDARLPLCSSSLDGERAALERERALTRLLGPSAPSREALERFHRSHEPERGPWSACMHRRDAVTVSASRIRVDAQRVAIRYAAGSPCTASFGPWLESERTG